MDEMGGLHRKMPVTTWTFIIAALANAGVVPLAGFWSKDEILHALENHVNVLWLILALVWVVISGLYTTRLIQYPFYGEPRDRHAYDHAHESGFFMGAPLVILGIASIVVGLGIIPAVAEGIAMPHGFGALVYNHAEGPEQFEFSANAAAFTALSIVAGLLFVFWLAVDRRETRRFLAGVEVVVLVTLAAMLSPIALGGTLAALAGIFFTAWLLAEPGRIQRFTAAIPGLYALVRNKFYFDEMYQWLIDRVVLVIAFAVAWFDRHLINDTGVDGTSNLTNYFGFRLKFAQTGRIPNYALVIVIGVLTLAVIAFTTRT
jgi:NADH-quinone oxidoreductase subunit L